MSIHNHTFFRNLNKTITAAYHAQKGQAAERGIPFRLTLMQWIDFWWQPDPIVGDGVPAWYRRGRGRDQYVMSRPGDVGAYEVGNIEISTNVANVRARKLSPLRFSFTEERRRMMRENRLPRPVRTPKGDFRSLSDAARAHDRAKSMIRLLCLTEGSGFTYLDEGKA